MYRTLPIQADSTNASWGATVRVPNDAAHLIVGGAGDAAVMANHVCTKLAVKDEHCVLGDGVPADVIFSGNNANGAAIWQGLGARDADGAVALPGAAGLLVPPGFKIELAFTRKLGSSNPSQDTDQADFSFLAILLDPKVLVGAWRHNKPIWLGLRQAWATNSVVEAILEASVTLGDGEGARFVAYHARKLNLTAPATAALGDAYVALYEDKREASRTPYEGRIACGALGTGQDGATKGSPLLELATGSDHTLKIDQYIAADGLSTNSRELYHVLQGYRFER